MAKILLLPSITLIFIAITGNQVIFGGARTSSHKKSHFQPSHHKTLGSKEDKIKQNTANRHRHVFHPTPQEPHFEAPVKKSLTSTNLIITRKILSNGLQVRNRVKDPLAKRVLKQTEIKTRSGSGKGLELSDDFLAGSVKQSNAIENALSFQRGEIISAFREIPHPVDEKIKRTNPNGRATKSTIEILSEKTNPEEGAEVARFRSEAQDKMAETSLNENKEEESLGNDENGDSVFRRTMPKMIKEKEKATTERKKRSFQEDPVNSEFYGNGDDNSASATNYGLEEGWEVPGKRKHVKNDETTMLKHLLRQDTMAFGTLQENKDEQNTIREIEKLSKQSSTLPKNLHLPYMSGPLDDMGLDFSKMDVSVGKLDTSENNDYSEGAKGIFLKRNSMPATGGYHNWETRNRNQIPRHHIVKSVMESEPFEHFPKYVRYPSFYRAPEIRPIEMDQFNRLGRFPPIAPAILSREDLAPREPIPLREAEPEDEPPPVSEFIEADEPAPIPELPSLREIPPISEIREPEPKDLDPKDTFGSKGKR